MTSSRTARGQSLFGAKVSNQKACRSGIVWSCVAEGPVPGWRVPTPRATSAGRDADAGVSAVPVAWTDPKPADYLRQADLIPEMLPFFSATLWRKVKSGVFPAPLKLSKAVTAWRRSKVEDWLAAKGQPAAVAKKKARKLWRAAKGRRPPRVGLDLLFARSCLR